MAVGEHGLFARVLDDLCKHPPDRPRWTNEELAAAIRARGGDIGQAYIAQLRKGHKDNPTRQTIEDLAGALGVHPACFVGGRRDLVPGHRAGWRPEAIRHLFNTVYPAGRGPYSPEEVASAIRADGRHGSISASYLRDLLAGGSANPRLKHLLGIANHFGVPPAYFFDDDLARRIDEDRAHLAQLRELGVEEFATRLARHAPTMLPQTRRATIEAITRALQLEQHDTARNSGR